MRKTTKTLIGSLYPIFSPSFKSYSHTHQNIQNWNNVPKCEKLRKHTVYHCNLEYDKTLTPYLRIYFHIYDMAWGETWKWPAVYKPIYKWVDSSLFVCLFVFSFLFLNMSGSFPQKIPEYTGLHFFRNIKLISLTHADFGIICGLLSPRPVKSKPSRPTFTLQKIV